MLATENPLDSDLIALKLFNFPLRHRESFIRTRMDLEGKARKKENIKKGQFTAHVMFMSVK